MQLPKSLKDQINHKKFYLYQYCVIYDKFDIIWFPRVFGIYYYQDFHNWLSFRQVRVNDDYSHAKYIVVKLVIKLKSDFRLNLFYFTVNLYTIEVPKVSTLTYIRQCYETKNLFFPFPIKFYVLITKFIKIDRFIIYWFIENVTLLSSQVSLWLK